MSVRAVKEKAAKLVASGQFERAEVLLRQALTQSPRDVQTWLRHAEVLKRLSRNVDAVASYRLAARILDDEGHHPRAVAALKLALSLVPDDVDLIADIIRSEMRARREGNDVRALFPLSSPSQLLTDASSESGLFQSTPSTVEAEAPQLSLPMSTPAGPSAHDVRAENAAARVDAWVPEPSAPVRPPPTVRAEPPAPSEAELPEPRPTAPASQGSMDGAALAPEVAPRPTAPESMDGASAAAPTPTAPESYGSMGDATPAPPAPESYGSMDGAIPGAAVAPRPSSPIPLVSEATSSTNSAVAPASSAPTQSGVASRPSFPTPLVSEAPPRPSSPIPLVSEVASSTNSAVAPATSAPTHSGVAARPSFPIPLVSEAPPRPSSPIPLVSEVPGSTNVAPRPSSPLASEFAAATHTEGGVGAAFPAPPPSSPVRFEVESTPQWPQVRRLSDQQIAVQVAEGARWVVLEASSPIAVRFADELEVPDDAEWLE